MKPRALLIFVYAALAFTSPACSGPAPHLSVADFKSGYPPPSGQPLFRGAQGNDPVVKGVVADQRETDRLVLLSSGGEDIWVSLPGTLPDKGEQVWVAIVGAKKEIGVQPAVYPALGPFHPVSGLTQRGVLGLITGGAALVSGALVGIVALVDLRRRPRRCAECSRRVQSDWLTCPACGNGLITPVLPESSVSHAVLPAPEPEPLHEEPLLEEPVVDRPTRIIYPE